LVAGNYQFYITDSNQCETSENTSIESPKPLEISFIDNTLLAKGGTLPYTYSSDGRMYGTTNTFPNLGNGFHTLSVKDSRGCMNSIHQYIENKVVTPNSFEFIPTSITTTTDSDFTLYPNPTDDDVFISSATKPLTITVFDASGRKVLETSNLHFSVKGWAKGFYMVKVGTITKKLIIR
jgi:hypothetical protein